MTRFCGRRMKPTEGRTRQPDTSANLWRGSTAAPQRVPRQAMFLIGTEISFRSPGSIHIGNPQGGRLIFAPLRNMGIDSVQGLGRARNLWGIAFCGVFVEPEDGDRQNALRCSRLRILSLWPRGGRSLEFVQRPGC